MNPSYMKSIDKNLIIRVICYSNTPQAVVFVIFKDDPIADHHPTVDYDRDAKYFRIFREDIADLIPEESIEHYYKAVSEMAAHQFDIEFFKEHYQESSFELLEQLRSE